MTMDMNAKRDESLACEHRLMDDISAKSSPGTLAGSSRIIKSSNWASVSKVYTILPLN